MRVLAINPPKYEGIDYVREGRCMQPKSVWNNIWPPLTLLYIASILQKHHKVKLVDCIGENKDLKHVQFLIETFKPEIIIINTALPTIKGDFKVAELAKSINSDIKTITFGIYPTILTEECLKNYEIDFAVFGEPELTIADLISSIDIEDDLSKVNGIAFLKNGKVFQTPKRDYITNLDKLGIPDRSLLKNKRYLFPFDRKPFTLVLIGRGCPFECNFCITPNYYGNTFRKRSPKKVVDEIQECVRKFKIKYFMFWGESFTINKNYGMAICDEILKRDLKIKWMSTSRVDTLDRDILRKMKKSGCILLGLGIESGNDQLLKNANKNISLEKIYRAIQICKEVGVLTMGHFIFGFPGETKETALKTIKFSKTCGVDYAQFYCMVPYPKTPLYEIYKKNGWLKTDDWTKYEQNNCVMDLPGITREELMNIRQKAFKEFYFRPTFMLKHAKRIRRPEEIFNTMSSLFSVVKWFAPKKIKK